MIQDPEGGNSRVEVKSKAEGCRLRGAFIRTLPFIPSKFQGTGEFFFFLFFFIQN